MTFTLIAPLIVDELYNLDPRIPEPEQLKVPREDEDELDYFDGYEPDFEYDFND